MSHNFNAPLLRNLSENERFQYGIPLNVEDAEQWMLTELEEAVGQARTEGNDAGFVQGHHAAVRGMRKTLETLEAL